MPRLSIAAFRMRLYIAVAKTCLYRTIRATCATNRAPEPAGEGVSAAAEMVPVTDCKSNGESGPKMTSRHSLTEVFQAFHGVFSPGLSQPIRGAKPSGKLSAKKGA